MQSLIAGDRDRFMELEHAMREQAEMPPYGKLAAIIIEGVQEQEVINFARLLISRPVPVTTNSPRILGPVPAPIARIQGRFRYRILIKAEKNFPLQHWLATLISAHPTPSSLKVKIDVEPYSFM